MGRPTSTLKITPCRGAIANPKHLPHHRIQPTHHPKRHPDPIIRFFTIHPLDTRTQTEGDTDTPTDRWDMRQTCSNTRLRSIVLERRG